MAGLSKRKTAIAAYHLAQYLLHAYRSEQVFAMVEEFASAGFTKTELIHDTNVLYRFVVIAAYDRSPFTRATGGYETIWEIGQKGQGVPSLLSSVGLWSADAVINIATDEIDARLSSLNLGGLPMNQDGGYTQFGRTLIDIARLSTDEFHKRLMSADKPTEIDNIFKSFTRVHGIGETIASKLIKYLLREIAIGRAEPENFPLSVVWPIVQEYHAGEAVSKLHGLSPNLVPLTAGILLYRGDAYAIDSLFFLQRNRSAKLNELINKLSTL